MDDRKEENMKKEENGRKVYVVGHKNPDTDSICSAIAYADLKTKLTGIEHTPRRAGQLNEETQYVLERFGVKVPALLSDLRVQIKDVELRHVEGIQGSMSIKTAWAEMKELNIKTLPVTRNGKLEGLITIGDIATSYMDVYSRHGLQLVPGDRRSAGDIQHPGAHAEAFQRVHQLLGVDVYKRQGVFIAKFSFLPNALQLLPPCKGLLCAQRDVPFYPVILFRVYSLSLIHI